MESAVLGVKCSELFRSWHAPIASSCYLNAFCRAMRLLLALLLVCSLTNFFSMFKSSVPGFTHWSLSFHLLLLDLVKWKPLHISKTWRHSSVPEWWWFYQQWSLTGKTVDASLSWRIAGEAEGGSGSSHGRLTSTNFSSKQIVKRLVFPAGFDPRPFCPDHGRGNAEDIALARRFW